MPHTTSSVYTCGRMHKPRKHKIRLPSDKAAAVVKTVVSIMREELSGIACERWLNRLNAELGIGTFRLSLDDMDIGEVTPVPHVWMPPKPKLAMALLDEFACSQHFPSCQNSSPKTSKMGVANLTKMLARAAVKRLREGKTEWLQSCSELTSAQKVDPTKLTQTLARVAFDLLVYVHARGVELQREDGAESAVLILHGSDQTLVGRALRGCGIVHCETGRALLARAVAMVRQGLVDAQLV